MRKFHSLDRLHPLSSHLRDHRTGCYHVGDAGLSRYQIRVALESHVLELLVEALLKTLQHQNDGKDCGDPQAG